MRPSIVHRPLLAVLVATLVACGSSATDGEPTAYEPAPSQPPAGEPTEPIEPADPAEPGEVAFTTIEQRSVPGKVGEQVREVSRDSASWQAVWDDLAGDSGLPNEAPAVDFESEMAIAAAMPTQGCVSKVTIRGIAAEAGGGLVVDLLEQPPAEGVVCVTSERPFHAVRLARHDGEVRWQVETRPLDPGEAAGSEAPPGR